MVKAGQGLMATGALLGTVGLALIPEGPWPRLWDIELSWWLVILGLGSGLTGLVLYVVGQPKPLVTLHEPDAFHVGRVAMFFPSSSSGDPGAFPVDVLFLRVINRSRSPSSRSSNARVTAHFTVTGLGAEDLPSLDARWSDTVQPRPGDLPERAVDLEVDAGRQIVLVVKEPDRPDCYLFNNDSYNFGRERGQRPEWRLGPGRYTARVRVTGENVREHFSCEFENPGANESLRVLSWWQE